MATIEDFRRLDLRVGRIVDARPFPEARKPSYQLLIDFGPLGLKRSAAQLTGHYTPASLMGSFVVAVLNLPPRQIARFFSDVLVLGSEDAEGRIVLLRPDRDVPLGSPIS